MLSRIKFDIDSLVNEILDQLPEQTWKSRTTTFLDPAIGGGQFIRAIEQRLRAAGHSDKNISGRVYGCESSKLSVQYARNKYKLVATLGVGDFLEKDFGDMRFDNVIGNPPFKNGNETGGASSLWRKFVSKSWELVSEKGIHAMIAPQFPNSSKDLGRIFSEHQTNVVWTKISNHFPGVGSSFYAWTVTKDTKLSKTNFINENVFVEVTDKPFPKNFFSISIIEKLSSFDKFECLSSPEYLHTSVADGKDDDYLHSQPNPNLPYIIRRTSGDNYQMYGSVLPTDYEASKVVLTFSGNPHYKFHDKRNPIGTIKYQSGYILVKNKAEGENLIHLYNSKLYKFVQNQQATGGFRGKKIYELPRVSLNKKWSDHDLYSHFKLTPEEIDYIEAMIK